MARGLRFCYNIDSNLGRDSALHTEAIVFDLDDTLLRDDRTVSAFTTETLREAASRGIRIIPASGRARDSMRPVVELLGCACCYIACNGAEVWSADHRLLLRRLFPEETALRIAAFGRRHGVYMQTYDSTHFYYNEESQWARSYAAASMLSGFLTPEMEDFIREHPTSKVLMMAETEKIAAMLEEARNQFGAEASVTCSKPYFLEFNPPGATKGDALRWCAEQIGFRMEAAVAFGDSLNDLSMLQAAGTGVAMGNAWESVRAVIPEHCPGNNEDGVAVYIRRRLAEEGLL